MNLRRIADFTVLLAHRGLRPPGEMNACELVDCVELTHLIDVLSQRWRYVLLASTPSENDAPGDFRAACEDLLALDGLLRVCCAAGLEHGDFDLAGTEDDDHPLLLGPLKQLVEQTIVAAQSFLNESEFLRLTKLQRRLGAWTDQLLAVSGASVWGEAFANDPVRFQQFREDLPPPECGDVQRLREDLERIAYRMIFPDRELCQRLACKELDWLTRTISSLIQWSVDPQDDLPTQTRQRIIDQSRYA